MRSFFRAGAALLFGLFAMPSHAATPVAVFDFELIDTSLVGETRGVSPEETQRLARLGEALRHFLAEKGYVAVDITPQADAIAKAGRLHACNDCVADLARPLGAALAITGTVQKVSELILNINVYVWRVADGAERYRASVDIRGNTDESWSRGLSYLARRRLIPALEKTTAD